MLINFLKRYSFKEIIGLLLEDHIGSLLRGIPSYEGILLRRLAYKLIFKKIGEKCFFFQNIYVTHGFNIVAGDYFSVNNGVCLDGRGGIVFGDYVMIGPNVFICPSNHVLKAANPRLFLGHKLKKVVIGSNVWIGGNAVILPGVKIGDNSIVGAGSVVTKNVEESTIVAGNPAKVIRSIK